MGEDALLKAAYEAAASSYAPYSNFHVGAALLAEDGKVYTGCNVENASYGLSICAERVALGKAVSEGARAFKAIAIVAKEMAPCVPCGACRQVLNEFAPRLTLYLDGKTFSLEELLPEAFGPEDLSV